MRNLAKTSLALSATIAMALGLAGCADSEQAEPEEITVVEEQNEPEPEPEVIVYDSSTLTGVKFVENSNPLLTGPALSAKIDNFERARPQTGLNAADIVVVERVESGLTRFVATWHSSMPEEIGPIRSIRPMDPNIVSPYGGIMAYSGGQDRFMDPMMATELYNATEDTEVGKETMFRKQGTGKPYEHTLYVRAGVLVSQHGDLPAPQQQFNFADLEAGESSSAESGETFNQFQVNYKESTSGWVSANAEYSFSDEGIALPTGETATHSAMQRIQDGDPLIDNFDGSQVRSKNVIVMETELDFSAKDPAYGSIPETVLVGASGNGWYFTDGKYIEIQWSKDGRTDPIVFTLVNGDPLVLNPGPTWIEYLDTYSANIQIDGVIPGEESDGEVAE